MSKTELTLEEAIAGAKKGNRKCQKYIYTRYAPLLYTVCRRYNYSGLDSKDLVQEAFVEIFRSLPNYNNQLGAFKNWATSITIRMSIKASKKFKRSYDVLTELIEIEDTNEKPLDRLSAEELLQVIEKIPEDYRLVFNLYAIEGYKHKEIGELLGIQESSSRSKLKRARDMIINLVEPEIKKLKVL